jgi:hypothetical protein
MRRWLAGQRPPARVPGNLRWRAAHRAGVRRSRRTAPPTCGCVRRHARRQAVSRSRARRATGDLAATRWQLSDRELRLGVRAGLRRTPPRGVAAGSGHIVRIRRSGLWSLRRVVRREPRRAPAIRPRSFTALSRTRRARRLSGCSRAPTALPSTGASRGSRCTKAPPSSPVTAVARTTPRACGRRGPGVAAGPKTTPLGR